MTPESVQLEPIHLALTVLSMVGGLVWATIGITRALKSDGEKTRADGEARAVRTHERIDDLRQHIDDKCVAKDVFHSELRRVDDALRERDQIHADLSSRLGCPTRGDGL
jgi:hypothetical protein